MSFGVGKTCPPPTIGGLGRDSVCNFGIPPPPRVGDLPKHSVLRRATSTRAASLHAPKNRLILAHRRGRRGFTAHLPVLKPATAYCHPCRGSYRTTHQSFPHSNLYASRFTSGYRNPHRCRGDKEEAAHIFRCKLLENLLIGRNCFLRTPLPPYEVLLHKYHMFRFQSIYLTDILLLLK